MDVTEGLTKCSADQLIHTVLCNVDDAVRQDLQCQRDGDGCKRFSI
jgi:hypothetical protein